MAFETEQEFEGAPGADEGATEAGEIPAPQDITNSKLDWKNAGTRYQVYALIAMAVGVGIAAVYDHLKEQEPDPYAPAVTAPKSANQH